MVTRPFASTSPYVSTYPLLTLSPPRWNKKTKPRSLIIKNKKKRQREEEESSLALVLLAAPPPPAAQVSFRPPLGLQDEKGNLPIQQVSSIPVLAASAMDEQGRGEQQDNNDCKEDGDLVQLAQTKGTNCRVSNSSYKCDEDDTLSTAGSSTTECTTNTTSAGRFLDTPPRSTNKKKLKQLGSIEQHQLNVNSDSSSSSIDSWNSTTNEEEQEDDQQMRAMLVMKDVIFRQRSAIKKLTKENKNLHKKYDFYKLQNETLSRANEQMKREVNQVCKKNEELELEVRNLRMTAAAASLNFGNKVEILQN